MRSAAALALGALLTAGWLAVGCGGTASSDRDTATTSTSPPAPAADVPARPGRLPADFLGVVSEDAFAAGTVDRARILAGQRRTGVQLLRQTFDWSTIERKRGRYDFSVHDAYVRAATRARIRLLPIIFRAPAFRSRGAHSSTGITSTTTYPPRRNADMARFATVLVRRYGPQGSFWRADPQLPALPIRAWQVWNEPNLPAYWGGRPNAREYVRMLRAVSAAIHRADRSAEVVTGGIPDSRLGIGLRPYLRAMRAAGGLGSFDTLAIHPYSRDPAGALAAVVSVRRLLDGWGRQRTPIWVTELGWASDGPRSAFTVGPQRQAEYVLDAITTLGRRAATLKVRGVVYYSWRDTRPYAGGKDFWGLHTGLLKLDGEGKTALSTYYQAAGVLSRGEDG